MGWTFKAAGTIATGSNPAVPLPSGYSAGDLLVIAVASTSSYPSAQPSGWTLASPTNTSNAPYLHLFYKFASASESEPTVTITDSSTVAQMFDYSGITGIDNGSGYGSLTANTSSSITSTGLTTSNPGDLVITLFAQKTVSSGSSGFSNPSGVNTRSNQVGTTSRTALVLVDYLMATAGTTSGVTANVNPSATQHNSSIQYSFSAITPVALAGSADEISAAQATPTIGPSLSGPAIEVSGAPGTLSETVPIAGSATEVSHAQANTSVAQPLAGAATEVSTAQGNLFVPVPLAGSAVEVSVAQGTVINIRPMSGSAVESTNATGNLKITGFAMQGQATEVSTASASPSETVPLAGSAIESSQAVGNLFAGIAPTPPFNPGPPPFPDVIKSYLYWQYSDDADLQAFVASYNAIAQSYLDWFNNTPLAVYTSAAISGALLDWIGNGLYGIARPVISTFIPGRQYGAINTRCINAMALNRNYSTATGTAEIANDDIYKRVLTWHLYLGDGRQMTMQWLRRRIARFVYGINGGDVDLSSISSISIIFPTGVLLFGGLDTFPVNTQAINSLKWRKVTLKNRMTIIVPNITMAQYFENLFTQNYLAVPFQIKYQVFQS